jgi:hypothetical protein
MTRKSIFTALRLVLSLAMTDPAQAWSGLAGVAGLAPPPNAIALVRKAHPYIRNTAHAPTKRPPTMLLPDREEDPLASMHFE